jgi:hypothetical protein
MPNALGHRDNYIPANPMQTTINQLLVASTSGFSTVSGKSVMLTTRIIAFLLLLLYYASLELITLFSSSFSTSVQLGKTEISSTTTADSSLVALTMWSIQALRRLRS